MERTSPIAALNFFFRLMSLSQGGVSSNSDESIQLWIELFYAR
jgi:hypothetical protein